MAEQYDVIGLGNAIVDVVSFVDEAGLAKLGLNRGAMTLINEAQAETLYHAMGQSTEMSGGSVANTLAAIASLGAKGAFIGKVRDDQLGDIFRHDMRSVGVAFDTKSATEGPATARCLIFVTPDAQRTMGTYIGACAEVSPDDVDESLIAAGKITYVEGYLWDQPAAKDAIRKALKTARKMGKKVAFSLSDLFCVERHRREFFDLASHYTDILFCNEPEAAALCEDSNFNEIVSLLQGRAEIVVVTRSDKGSVVITPNDVITVPAAKVAQVMDTTGAGDLYAAGFLYGLTHGYDLRRCAELGSRCASQIIAQVGARSMRPLKELLAA